VFHCVIALMTIVALSKHSTACCGRHGPPGSDAVFAIKWSFGQQVKYSENIIIMIITIVRAKMFVLNFIECMLYGYEVGSLCSNFLIGSLY